MRVSKLFNKTLKEDPAEAEVVSHALLIRSGMIRKLSSGVFTYLPLGWRVLNKISNIIREEMNSSDCQELMMPIIQPKELWEQSGRWFVYGKELIRLKDRHDREYCLSPTHEEVITTVVKNEIRSYKDLPLNLYQIQNKYRDEVRPRFGLIRSREFLMKDGYSFNRDEESLSHTYQEMYEAYTKIFTRCGLNFRAVEADSGAIGGSSSHEFMVLADTGEAALTYCESCDYAANMEMAVHGKRNYENGNNGKLEEVHTPNKKSIDEVSEFLNIKPELMLKTLVYKAIFKDDEKLICVVVRGNREVNEIKLKNAVSAIDLNLADNEEVLKATNTPIGFLGPIGLIDVDIYVDEEVMEVKNGATGALKEDYHFIGVNPKRDFPKSSIVGDYHNVDEYDHCPKCDGKLSFKRGTEVGQVFKLGKKYSEKLDCKFLDDKGVEQHVTMGCYGIGVGRTMAASVEQNNDDRGIIWPIAIAPYHVIIIPVNMKNGDIVNIAEDLYKSFKEENIEVILDDTEERAGVKFANADLIGYPIKIVIGSKTLEDKTVDLKIRATGEELIVPLYEALGKIKEILL
ncbi:MAG: prolyl-tRNA synthetase [Fusobacteria bacterium]|nr:MAG: prolyl-tRNA synthetase [Fusobacteriota bacterium]KAF0229957.1 MAG: prolyl-tRNA [Fusobacteriota bacterium]